MMLVVLLSPSIGYTSDCWEVSNLKGYSSYSKDDYMITKDGDATDPFFLILDNDNPRISSFGKDYHLTKIGDDIYVIITRNDTFVIIESFMIDRKNHRVIYVKNRKSVNQGMLSPLQSGSLFVGDCNPCYTRLVK